MRYLSFLILITCTTPFLRSASAKKKPNILILYADDMGYGDVGVYNPSSKIPTPNLDKLANEGIRFTDGHSSSGVCSPSRYGILTGRYHWRKFHRIVEAWGDCVIDDEQLTMPEMLKENGYHTAAIGKWHLGMGWEANKLPGAKRIESVAGKGQSPDSFDWSKPVPNGPVRHGFDYYFGDGVINFPPYAWIENDKVLTAPDRMWNPEGWPEAPLGNWGARPGPMVEGWNPYDNVPTTMNKAIDFIQTQANSKEPFFLYFAFPSPHVPVIPRAEFIGTSQAGFYGDYVCETDDVCGKIIKALEHSGQADNTIIVFTTDNGAEALAYKTDEQYNHQSSGEFRGVKRDIYEGGHHLPFIIKWPGVTKPGTVSNALVSQIDLMGTFADVLGYKLPDNQAEDSYSFLPVLQGKTDVSRRSMIHNTRDDQWAIRKGDWVLVNATGVSTQIRERAKKKWYDKHNYPHPEKETAELYNLREDIGQRYNVSDQYPEKVEEMQNLLKTIREQGYSSPRITQN